MTVSIIIWYIMMNVMKFISKRQSDGAWRSKNWRRAQVSG